MVSALLAGATLTLLSHVPASAATSVTTSLVATVHVSGLSPPSPDPAGITYLPGSNRFLMSDSEVEEMSIWAGVNVWELTPAGSQTDTGSTASYSKEPTGLGFDPATGRLFVSDDSADKIFVILPGGDGRYGTADDVRSSFSTRAYGSSDPEDVAFDTATGELFTADGAGIEIYRVSPGPNGTFDGVPPAGDDSTSHFDVALHGAKNAEGLGYDENRDTLLVVDNRTKAIYEVTTGGSLVSKIDLSAANPKHAEDVAVAPPSGGTGGVNLYVVDRGVDNGSNPNENDGKMYELSVNPPPVGNLPPIVGAGPDQTVSFPADAALDGSVSDDGLPNPPGAFTMQWSTVSGPGTVTFGSANSEDTTASFSGPGTYVLRLTADDTALTSWDEVTVTSVGSSGTSTLDVPIAASSDDAEEPVGMKVTLSSDLDIVDAPVNGNQIIGLRFTGLSIPAGATILNAYVQFTAKETTSVATSLSIVGQAADNPPTFTSAAGNISSRAPTAASVSWSPVAPWTTGAAGADQRTPDLSTVIQEIVSRPGWASGNALVLMISGTGTRVAKSFDNGVPPVLHIEYSV